MAVETKLFEPQRDLFRGFEQIREKQDDAPAVDQARRLLEQLAQAGPAPRTQHVQLAQHKPKLVGPLRRPDELRRRVPSVEAHHPGRVVLPQQKPGQGRRQHFGALQLRPQAAAPRSCIEALVSQTT